MNDYLKTSAAFAASLKAPSRQSEFAEKKDVANMLTYNSDGSNLTVIIDDAVIGKMRPEQLESLHQIKYNKISSCLFYYCNAS